MLSALPEWLSIGSSDVYTAMEAEDLSQQALIDAFLDGAINSNDPRFALLPAHLRAEVVIREQLNAKFQAIEQRRQAVLAETGTAFEGSVSIAYSRGSKPSVLVINGLSMTDDDWFYRRLFGIPNTYDSRGIPRDDPFNQAQARLQAAAKAWSHMDSIVLSFGYGEDVALVRKCQDAIVSGTFHAVIVCDLSLRDLIDPDDGFIFDKCLGSHLQAFARAGGHVAFPTSDGLLLGNVGVLQRLFGVQRRRHRGL